MRECGLKYATQDRRKTSRTVTPHAGVWIEMIRLGGFPVAICVTPHAGVWIEIYHTTI